MRHTRNEEMPNAHEALFFCASPLPTRLHTNHPKPTTMSDSMEIVPEGTEFSDCFVFIRNLPAGWGEKEVAEKKCFKIEKFYAFKQNAYIKLPSAEVEKVLKWTPDEWYSKIRL